MLDIEFGTEKTKATEKPSERKRRGSKLAKSMIFTLRKKHVGFVVRVRFLAQYAESRACR
jgi:hypothetical protein